MADDTKAQVVIGAQIDELKSGMDEALAKVQQSLGQMQTGLKQMESQTQASTQAITSGFKEMQSGIQSTISSISSTITTMTTAFLGIGALLAGGALFKGVVDKFVEMNSEAKKLSTVMNTDMQSAAAMINAFERVGISGDSLISMEGRMVRQLKANEDQFTKNGVATRDASGAMLPMEQITMNVISRLGEMKGGYDQMAVSQMAFGRGQSDINALLKITPEAIEAAREHLNSLGLTFDDLSASKARAFKEGIHDVELVFDAMKYQIGQALLPELIKLGQWFTAEGPAMIKGTVNAINQVRAVFIGAGEGFRELMIIMQAGWTATLAVARGFYLALQLLIAGETDAANKAYEAGLQIAVNTTRKAAADIKAMQFVATWKIETIFSSSGGKYGPGGYGSEGETDFPGGKPKGGGASFEGKEKGGGKGGEGSQIQQWQNELDQMKLAEKAYQDQSLTMEKAFWADKLNTGKTATKEQEDQLKAAEKAAATERLTLEKAFWTSKLSEVEEGTKEYIEVQHKIVGLEQNINKQRLQSEIDLIKSKIAANQQSIKEQESLLDQEQKLAKLDLAMKREDVNYLAQLGKTTKAQELQEYKMLLAQEQALDLQDMQKRQALYAGDVDKYPEYTKKIEILKRQQALDMKKVDDQISVASASTWSKMFESAQSSMSSFVSTLFNSTQNLLSQHRKSL